MFLTSATGLALLAFRGSSLMSRLLLIHLGFVMALFLKFPYGKFVHGIYRSSVALATNLPLCSHRSMRVLPLVGALIAFFPAHLLADSCSVPPPCGSLFADSVIFIGTTLSSTRVAEPSAPGEPPEYDIRFQVDEVFAGLPAGVHEVTVAGTSDWPAKGEQILVDAHGDQDSIGFGRCGRSGELTYPAIAEFVQFLRLRKAGKTPTSLTVNTAAEYRPVENVEVTITGSGATRRTVTDRNGNAAFKGLRPGDYAIAWSKQGYQPDPESSSPEDQQVSIPFGACPTKYARLIAHGTVSGVVNDSSGSAVPGLNLTLIEPKRPDGLTPVSFLATTDAHGRFRFDSVSPGRYLFATNVGLADSPFPPTYYPGVRSADLAASIELELGEQKENVVFTLPDYGAPRKLRLCVVDEDGKPVPGASLRDQIEWKDAVRGLLTSPQHHLRTGPDGCAAAQGYSKVEYRIEAFWANGVNFRSPEFRSKYSDPVEIPPGPEPFEKPILIKPYRQPAPR